jgi:c-di-GMP-binding flagellar brake protein YcgR
MSEPNEASAHIGLLNAEHYADYLIRNASEIMLMLRRMRDSRVLLNVFIDGGPHRFVSAVLDAGPRGIVLDASADERLNKHAAASELLTCAAQLDGVRVQFDLPGAQAVLFDKLPALHAQLPTGMLRLQRRDTYRLAVPLHSPVGCIVRYHPKQPEGAPVDAPPPEPITAKPRVVDISMDGIALVFAEDELPLSVGMDLSDCKLTLPDSESTKVLLRVRNLHHTTNPQGGRNVRAGCQMIDVPARFTQLIQRYIFKVERERRLMEAD